MKVDYLSEFGFRLSDYGEYRERAGEGRAGPERRPLSARDGAWGWGPSARRARSPVERRPRAVSVVVEGTRSCRERAGRSVRASVRRGANFPRRRPPDPARPGARPPARDALGPAGRDSGRAETGGPRDTKHSFLSSSFHGASRRVWDQGAENGSWNRYARWEPTGRLFHFSFGSLTEVSIFSPMS